MYTDNVDSRYCSYVMQAEEDTVRSTKLSKVRSKKPQSFANPTFSVVVISPPRTKNFIALATCRPHNNVYRTVGKTITAGSAGCITYLLFLVEFCCRPDSAIKPAGLLLENRWCYNVVAACQDDSVTKQKCLKM